SGGEGIGGVKIVGVDALDATLVQARQHLARTALDQIGHATLTQRYDGFDPTHRAVELSQQVALERVEIVDYRRTDVLHQGNFRSLPGRSKQRVSETLRRRAHQIAM